MQVTTDEWGGYAIAGLTKEELELVFHEFRDWAPHQNIFTTLHIPIPDGHLELSPIIEGQCMSVSYAPPDTLVFSNVAAAIVHEREITMDDLMGFLDTSR